MPYLWAASVFFASLIMENFLFKILKKIMNLIEYKTLDLDAKDHFCVC